MNSGMTVQKPSNQITEAGDFVPPATAKYASPKPRPRSHNDLGPIAQRLGQIQAAFRRPVGSPGPVSSSASSSMSRPCASTAAIAACTSDS